MANDELCWMPASELAPAIARRKVSPVEVVDAILARIDTLKALNAYVTVDADGARRAARAAERAAADRDARLGPLHGVPFSVKDLVLTKRMGTTFGTPLYRDHVPADDAPAVARLKAAGGILIGKTNTPTFGWIGITDNLLFGVTRNPWSLDHTPGGSSGGAAAAVAAGLAPLAVGTDGGGSIRKPASFTGTFGLKASYGRVPPSPRGRVERLPRRPPDAHGEGRRADAERDGRSRRARPVLAAGPPGGLHEGAARRPQGPAGGLQRHARHRARRRSRGAGGHARGVPRLPRFRLPGGCRRSEVDVPLRSLARHLPGWHRHTPGAASRPPRADRRRPAADHRGGPALAPDPSRRGLARATRLVAAGPLVLRDVRPAAVADGRVPAAPIGEMYATEIDGKSVGRDAGSVFTFPFNLTGQPAASVPCGFTKAGLPIGLQVVGRRFDDVSVLRACALFEAARPWAPRRPPPR